MSIKKIAVLTSGGDCPGLNAVVRAVTKSALSRGIRVIGFKNGFEGMVDNDFIELNDKSASGILTRGGTILGTSNIANPFNYKLPPLGSVENPKDVSDQAMHRIKTNEIDALITIGGEGTLAMSNQFIEKGLPVIGVPKTIDNDIAGTDITFGFDSALQVATEAIDRIHTTAQAHHRVMVIETMGRYAGWIALRSGIAAGGDIILLPEIPYNDDSIVKAIKKRRSLGKNFSIVVTSEGAKNEEGEQVVASVNKKSHDTIRLGGIGYKIADMITEKMKIESRVCVLGHLQRGGTPSPFDRWLSTRFGVAAIDLLIEGKFGHMLAYVNNKITSVPICDIADKLKLVDPHGEEVTTALRVGTSFGSSKIKL